MTYHYKSQAVLQNIVLKSAMFAFVAGLAVNLPLAVVLITTSMWAGCYDRDEFRRTLLLLPLIHLLVFLIVFLLMCSMFIIMSRGNDPKE